MIDGACEIALPPGKILVELSKGPEYRPQSVETNCSRKLALRFNVDAGSTCEPKVYSETRGLTTCRVRGPVGRRAEDLPSSICLAFEDSVTDAHGKKYKSCRTSSIQWTATGR